MEMVFGILPAEAGMNHRGFRRQHGKGIAMGEAVRKNMDKQTVMELYQELAVPGAPHQLLAGMAGSWNVKGTCSMEPGGSNIEHTGTSEQRMILGGRFLQQEFSGEMMGTPFTGIGFTGYDNHTRKYVSTWLDSMGTGIYYFEGTADADGKTITQTCSYDDPVRGPAKWRSVTRIVDANRLVFEMYITDQSGKEDKMAEMEYTRKS
jgi:hypothetical protein